MSHRNIPLGIGAMCLSMFGFVTNDAQVKLVSEELPLGEVIFLRGLVATVIVLGVVVFTGQIAHWRELRDRAVLWRTVGDVGATVLFLTALVHLPLANATIVLQTVPLAVTVAGALVLAEHVGWRRWVAVGVGLVGVLIVIRPGMAGFSPYSLVALAAVLFITLRDISTNRIRHAVPHLLVVAVAMVAATATGATMGLTEEWVWPDLGTMAKIVGAGMCLIVGHWFIIIALRSAPVSVTAPFSYTNVVWAVLLGYLIWGDRPETLTYVGAALVIGSGVYAFYRERMLARRTPNIDELIGGAGP